MFQNQYLSRNDTFDRLKKNPGFLPFLFSAQLFLVV